MTKQIKKNDEIIIDIDDISVEGYGIGRIDGAVVFCEGLLPKERAKVKVIKITKKFYVTKTVEILEPSPQRVSPPCPYFSQCGGCSLQHLSMPAQLMFKQSRVKATLRHIGGVSASVENIIPSPEASAYRNKAVFPVSKTERGVKAGFYKRHSHQVVDIDSCYIQHPALVNVLNITKDWLTRRDIPVYNERTGNGLIRHIYARISSTNEIMAGLVSVSEEIPETDALIKTLRKQLKSLKSFCVNINPDKTNAVFGDKTVCLYGLDSINHTIDGITFSVGFTSFLQINTKQTDRIYMQAMSFADIHPEDTVADLFCGIGTLTLLAARQAKMVYGIEYVPEAIENAAANAAANEIENVEWICGDCTSEFRSLEKRAGQIDVVIVDPPRKGLDAELIAIIIATAPRRIIYLSCDPATLARDLKRLSAVYDIKKTIPFDMFPQTTHVETLCLLEKK